MKDVNAIRSCLVVFCVVCFMHDVCEAQSQHWQHRAGAGGEVQSIDTLTHTNTPASEAL